MFPSIKFKQSVKNISLFCVILSLTISLTSILPESDSKEPKEKENSTPVYISDNIYYRELSVSTKDKQEESDEEPLRGFIVDYMMNTNGNLGQETYYEIADNILKYSNNRDLDPILVTSLIRQESTFDPNNVGNDNDLGLMQIIPSTAQWIASEIGIQYSYNKMFDIETNIRMGTWYLSVMIDKFGCEDQALVAYNKGPQNAEYIIPQNDDYNSAVRYHYYNITEEK